jgi:pimeloyl-ACP methyl ester carboxylesterase
MPPPLPRVDGVEHREVVLRGLRLHVALAGPEGGRPVVLQHGFPQHWYSWRHLFGPLASAGYRVVAPDFRGFGWSEHPPDEDFRMETLVDELVALCGEFGYERVAYVGHDWGAFVGWLLCLNRPDFLERAVLMSVPPPFPPERIEPAALLRLAKLWYQLPIASALPARAKVAFFRQILDVGRAGPWEPGVVDEYMRTLSQPAQVRAGTLLYRQFLTHQLPAMLARRYAESRLTMPVRFLIGRGDLFLEEGVVDQARPHADADYAGEVVPDVNHFVPEEAPELLRDRVLAFLA